MQRANAERTPAVPVPRAVFTWLHRDAQGRTLFPQGCVAAIGAFDGMHLGHQSLLAEVRNEARSLELPAVVICFAPLPRMYFQQQFASVLKTEAEPGIDAEKRAGTASAEFPALRPAPLFALTSVVQRLIQLEKRVDHVAMLRFNARMANLSAHDFVSEVLLQRFNIKSLWVGTDFRFGFQRRGDLALLQQFSKRFSLHSLAPVLAPEPQSVECAPRISATLIRTALAGQDVRAAHALLGRPYRFCGRVQHGQKLGRTLGFPTANFDFPESNPLRGIFAVRVSGAGLVSHPAVASLGTRPAVNGNALWLEVHLFDFEGDLYGKKLSIDFIAYLREEQNFSGLDALVAQIQLDAAAARLALKD